MSTITNATVEVLDEETLVYNGNRYERIHGGVDIDIDLEVKDWERIYYLMEVNNFLTVGETLRHLLKKKLVEAEIEEIEKQINKKEKTTKIKKSKK